LQLAAPQQSNASVQNAIASFNQKLEEQVYNSLKLKYVTGQLLAVVNWAVSCYNCDKAAAGTIA